MKNTKNYLMILLGIILLSIGIYLINSDITIAVEALPYVCVGVGSGIFGHGLGSLYENHIYKQYPDIAIEHKINIEDERNIMIMNTAKSKGYSLMIYMMPVIILSFALMNVGLEIVLTLVGVYLFIEFYTIYWRIQLDKKM